MIRASRELFHIAPELVIIPEDRQRKQDTDISDLIPSVRARGILLPLLLREETLELCAGWRRLHTALFLGLEDVPYRTIPKDASEIDIQLIELEENARRKDLVWQDKCAAMWKIHLLLVEVNGPNWTDEDSAGVVNYDRQHFGLMADLGESIANGDASIINAETQANATTILRRRRARSTDETVQRILERAKKPAGIIAGVQPRPASNGTPHAGSDTSADHGDVEASGEADARGDSLPNDDRPAVAPYSILCTDACEFLAGFGGDKFNLLHADLPYGVELNSQANQEAFEGGGYESNPDIYFHLFDQLLKHWDKFMFPSAHIMWWFAFSQDPEASLYEDTKQRFKKGLKNYDVRINPNPLIWHKTDNRGILPDPMRGPRNIGEYALLISTGDRKIVKPVANIYGAPTAKETAIHTNEKPEPMLRHFMSMLVDGYSRVLDPTAGSGSAIRVAESLGAEAALGLEMNPEFAERAQDALVRARGLRKLASAAKKEQA